MRGPDLNAPKRETFPAILDRVAAADPDRLFAETVAGEHFSWAELQQNVSYWADRFVTLGVDRGDIVCTILESGPRSLAIWLALVRLGAVDATINGEFRGRMLTHALDTCRPSLIVLAAENLRWVEAIEGDLQATPTIFVLRDEQNGTAPHLSDGKLSVARKLIFEENLAPEPGVSAPKTANPSWYDIACVTFTSGTTGPSKAVRMPWAQLNAINLATFPFESLGADDVFYCVTAHAHFGSKAIPYLAAMTGGRVVMRPRFGLSSFWKDIDRFGITTASLVGTMADMLMQSADSPLGDTTLRNLFMAPLGPSYQRFAERFDLRVCTVYNSTENGVPLCSGWNPSDPRTVGRLREGYPGFEVRIVDDQDNEVPDGTPGECIVRSSVPWTMNAGYLNNPEATAAAWRNGWFHTGDALVRNAAGDFSFVDRLKDVIRRRGENISSFEVEADAKLNPDVAECAAVAVPADTSEDEILLFVQPRAGADLRIDDLCHDLEARMTRFMVPRYIELVDEIPKTQATQRIMKSELRRRGVGADTWDREKQRYVGTAGA